MVKIRLTRNGKKREPIYRIVVSDSRNARGGKCIDEIGLYNPNTEPCTYKVDAEKAQKWLSNGAQPTEVVNRIFKLAGVTK